MARAPENEALLGPALRASRLSLREVVSRSLALRPGHETWIQIENGQIHGLAAAHARLGADVWDVDHLVIDPTIDADRVCQRLLDHLCGAAVEEGVQKVFLRLPEDSVWVPVARQVGFVHYTTEQVHVLPALEPQERPLVPGLRPRRPADHQSLFQLYSAVVPLHVRQIEAMTLQEWRWNDNWGFASVASVRPALSRRRRDLVVQSEGQIDVWLQVQTRLRTIQLLVDADAGIDTAVLLRRALSELAPPGPVGFSLRDYQGGLAHHLHDLGFQPGESQALLARLLAVRVPERRLVPARVV